MLKYIFHTTELTCASIDKMVFRAAPRFLTVGLGLNITSSVFRTGIRQTALVVGTGNHHYISFTIIKFEFVYSHPGSNTRFALLHNVT